MTVRELQEFLDNCKVNDVVAVDDCGALLKIDGIRKEDGVVKIIQSQECYE